ncbi:unnamed protein product [Scytosiphon promiscuus]
MPPMSPRADARPIGECKSSWGGEHRGGRQRAEGRASDPRTAPARARLPTGAGKGPPGAFPSGGVGTKHHPLPPPPAVASPSRQPRGVGEGGSPTQHLSRGGSGEGSDFLNRCRDDTVVRRPSVGGGSGRGIERRDSRDSSRSDDSRERGSGGRRGRGGDSGSGSGGGSGRGFDHPSRRPEDRSDRKKLARHGSRDRPGGSDSRGRSRGERDRSDGRGGSRRSSSSSSTDREEREKRKRREKEKATRRSASRERLRHASVERRRSISGESARHSGSLKRHRSTGQDTAETSRSGTSSSSRSARGGQGSAPRVSATDPVHGIRRTVSAPVKASPTILPLRPGNVEGASVADGRTPPSPHQPRQEPDAPRRGQPPLPPGPMPPPPPEHPPPPQSIVDSSTIYGSSDLPPPVAPSPPHFSPPRLSTLQNSTEPCVVQRDENGNIRSFGADDDMDLEDASSPPPRRVVVIGPPPQLLPVQTAPLPLAGPRQSLSLPPQHPPFPPPHLKPVLTVAPAPAPSTTHPQLRGFAPPVYTLPLYVHGGTAAALATPASAVVATASQEFRTVHTGAIAASTGTPGAGPALVTLPLGRLASPPAARAVPIKIATAATGGATSSAAGYFGPPTHSPDALSAGLAKYLSAQQETIPPTTAPARVLSAQQDDPAPAETEAQARAAQQNATLPIDRARHLLAAARRGNLPQPPPGAASQAPTVPTPASEVLQSAAYLETSPVFIPENQQQHCPSSGHSFRSGVAPSHEGGESPRQQHQHHAPPGGGRPGAW